MKESSRLLILLLSHLGHSLKNIETVFSGAVEELIASTNETHLAIGTDANIALDKLSKISNLVGCLENSESNDENYILVALKNLLLISCPNEESTSLLEIRKLNSESFKIELSCNEKYIRELLDANSNNIELPIFNILLINLIHSLIKEKESEIYLNNQKLT